MAQSTIAAKIDDLDRSYHMPEGDKIKAYLAAHPDIADLLLEARPHIELQFGHDVVVALRFPRDCECDRDRQDGLRAAIQSHDDADVAGDRWDRLWEEWWGDASGRPESLPLNIGIDFVEPVSWSSDGKSISSLLKNSPQKVAKRRPERQSVAPITRPITRQSATGDRKGPWQPRAAHTERSGMP